MYVMSVHQTWSGLTIFKRPKRHGNTLCLMFGNVVLGLGYIAAVLEKHHDVRAIDVFAEKLDDDSLSKRIRLEAPEIVGITSDTISFQRAIEIARMVKHGNPQRKGHVHNPQGLQDRCYVGMVLQTMETKPFVTYIAGSSKMEG